MAILQDRTITVVFSVASVWEIVIRSSLGPGGLFVDAAQLRSAALLSGMDELPIRAAHVLEVAKLPALHADPFDRILLAQARSEGMTLLTADRKLLDYGSPAQPA